MVICFNCGNNTCNGGGDCKYCDSAYELFENPNLLMQLRGVKRRKVSGIKGT